MDVHAIADLKSRGVPLTDDSPKYAYVASEEGGSSAKYSRGVKIFLSIVEIVDGNKILKRTTHRIGGSIKLSYLQRFPRVMAKS